jgi:tetratricopeptide (TPR) repeat protein
MRWGALYVLLAVTLTGVAIFASQAETEFRQALRLHNDNDLQKAAKTYRRALELDPTLVSAAINLAIIHEKWGENDVAEKLYDSAVRAAPKLFSARYNRGQFLQKQGRLAEARADYQVALQEKPDEAALHINLAAIEIRLFEMTRDASLLRAAELRLKKAAALGSSSPALFFNRARLAELSNAPGLARTQYREAMRRYPADSQEYRACALRAERLSRQLR